MSDPSDDLSSVVSYKQPPFLRWYFMKILNLFCVNCRKPCKVTIWLLDMSKFWTKYGKKKFRPKMLRYTGYTAFFLVSGDTDHLAGLVCIQTSNYGFTRWRFWQLNHLQVFPLPTSVWLMLWHHCYLCFWDMNCQGKNPDQIIYSFIVQYFSNESDALTQFIMSLHKQLCWHKWRRWHASAKRSIKCGDDEWGEKSQSRISVKYFFSGSHGPAGIKGLWWDHQPGRDKRKYFDQDKYSVIENEVQHLIFCTPICCWCWLPSR